jgi:4-amino-4-deoxy-L-arabinose transferase-like glycosyltransferase
MSSAGLAHAEVAVPRWSKAPLGRWLEALVERRGFAWAVLGLLCGIYFYYGLNSGELYRTEGLRAILAAEVLRSGNWIVPTLYGQPLFTKPPGMYVAIALTSWPFGEVTEASARFPSALAATITVWLFYWYFQRQLGRLGGFAAAIILPTTMMWLDKAPSAEIDMLQVAWVAAAILFFLRAIEEPQVFAPTAAARSRFQALWWFASLLCVAGGVLTKWTAPAFFYGTAVPLLWWRGRLRLLWGWPHVVAAGLGAVLCFSWAGAAIAQAGWDVFYRTVSLEALMRLSPAHHHRPYPWLEVFRHPFVILGANVPWSLCALLCLRPGFSRLWDERGRQLLQAMHCWTWPNLLFWSVIPEHAPRHSMPLCTGLAGLAAMVWLAWLKGDLAWPVARFRPGVLLAGMVVVWIATKVVFIHAIVPARNPAREPRAKAAQIAGAVPPGKILYLFRLKDEGIMFYYGQPVLRLRGPQDLPSSNEPLYCILTQADRQHWPPNKPIEVMLRLADEQGDPIMVVRTP